MHFAQLLLFVQLGAFGKLKAISIALPQKNNGRLLAKPLGKTLQLQHRRLLKLLHLQQRQHLPMAQQHQHSL